MTTTTLCIELDYPDKPYSGRSHDFKLEAPDDWDDMDEHERYRWVSEAVIAEIGIYWTEE